MDESGSDDVLDLVLERVDSHVSLIRAAAVCRRWRRAIADAAFLRRYRTLHVPPVAGYYYGGGPRFRVLPLFSPSSPPVVDARHFSLDFLPSGPVWGSVCSWTICHSRGSLLLLRDGILPRSIDKIPEMIVCEPLTRRYRRIHRPADFNDGCYWSVSYLIDGEADEAGGRISMSNFRVLCMCDTHGAMYTVGSSWSKKNIDHIVPSFDHLGLMGHVGGCWYFVQGRAMIILDGSTGDFSSSKLPSLKDVDADTWNHNVFITNTRDGKLHILAVFNDTIKMFTRIEGGEWALEKRVMLPEATRGLPGYEPSFFSGPQIVLTIGAGFVILQPEIGKRWPFSINLETMEASPAEVGMGPLVYEFELPWPPALHACLDR